MDLAALMSFCASVGIAFLDSGGIIILGDSIVLHKAACKVHMCVCVYVCGVCSLAGGPGLAQCWHLPRSAVLPVGPGRCGTF